MNDDDDIIDEVRRQGGLSAMASLDAIDQDFLDLIIEAGQPIKAAYRHLIDSELKHTAAIALIHGIIGAMMDEARREGEGPE